MKLGGMTALTKESVVFSHCNDESQQFLFISATRSVATRPKSSLRSSQFAHCEIYSVSILFTVFNRNTPSQPAA